MSETTVTMIQDIAGILIILVSSGSVLKALWEVVKLLKEVILGVELLRKTVPQITSLTDSVKENTVATNTVSAEFRAHRVEVGTKLLELSERVTALERR